MTSRLVAAAVVFVALAGCSGEIVDVPEPATEPGEGPAAREGVRGPESLMPPPGAPAAPGGPTVSPSAPSSTVPPGAGPGPAAEAGGCTDRDSPLVRLTAQQVRNTLKDLLGPAVKIPTDLEGEAARDGFTNITVASTALTARAIEQATNAAHEIAWQLFQDASARAAFVGCAPRDAADPCVASFIRTFGARAWRRPLAADEVATYQALVRKVAAVLSGGVWSGLEHAVAAMLASPKFLYRVERGQPAAGDTSLRRLGAHELAGRLSYSLWDTTPDAELMAAADRGDLVTDAGLRAQADRLLASPRARPALLRFFTEYLNVDDLASVTKDAKLFPRWKDTLAQSMRREMLAFVEDLAFGDRDFRELLDGRTTFVNAQLAGFYGLAPVGASAGYVKVQLPAEGERLGVLGLGGSLALNAHVTETSPTLRGRFVSERLLCRPIPPPPPDVAAELPPRSAGAPRTTRQRVEEHLADPKCAGCHALMDPLGLVLERFDATGAYRAQENGADIDASGRLDDVPVSGLPGLAAALRGSPAAAACVAQQLFRHVKGRNAFAADGPALAALARAFAGAGHRFRGLVSAFVLSEPFRTSQEVR